MKRLALLIIISILLTGCSSQKDAEIAALKKKIEQQESQIKLLQQTLDEYKQKDSTTKSKSTAEQKGTSTFTSEDALWALQEYGKKAYPKGFKISSSAKDSFQYERDNGDWFVGWRFNITDETGTTTEHLVKGVVHDNGDSFTVTDFYVY